MSVKSVVTSFDAIPGKPLASAICKIKQELHKNFCSFGIVVSYCQLYSLLVELQKVPS